MSESSDYIPAAVRTRLRGQAVKVWWAGVAVVLAWVAVIVAAPVLKSGGAEAVSSPVYHFFSFICHQIPERSLHVDGYPLAVCSRCFGVYVGLLLGFAAYPLWRRVDEIEAMPRFWLFLSMIPIGVDWALTVFGIWENTHLSRFLTGAILGFACGCYIVPALVEITRNLTARSPQSKKAAGPGSL
jgi:uncharacterized membrane protein